MKYLITESQLDIFLLRRFSIDELKGLKNDYNYAMYDEDFEDSADRDDHIYGLVEDFIDRHRGDEFFQYGNDTEFYEKRSEYIRALLKFLHSDSLNEDIERTWMDREYEDEYPTWKPIIMKFLDNKAKAYYQGEDGKIELFSDEEGNDCIIHYNPKDKTLWGDNSLDNDLGKFVPYHILARHFKYALQDYFKEQFPNTFIKDVKSANITRY